MFYTSHQAHVGRGSTHTSLIEQFQCETLEVAAATPCFTRINVLLASGECAGTRHKNLIISCFGNDQQNTKTLSLLYLITCHSSYELALLSELYQV